jgi:hypothetical protein
VLGYEPIGGGLRSMKADRGRGHGALRAVVRRTLRLGGRSNGQPGSDLAGLEAAAKLSHLRSHYKWASHETHADATCARINIYDYDYVSFKSSGPVRMGLMVRAAADALKPHASSAPSATPSATLDLRRPCGLTWPGRSATCLLEW